MSEVNKNSQVYFRRKAWIVETTYIATITAILTLVSLAIAKAINQIVFQDSVGIILASGVTIYVGIYFYDIYRSLKSRKQQNNSQLC